MKKAPNKFRLLPAFLGELFNTRNLVRWHIDPRHGLRAEAPELSHLLCPFQAIHYCRTGAAHPAQVGHLVGDPHLLAEKYGWGDFSLDVVEAADNDLSSDLGAQLLKAVGLRGKARN